MAAKSYDLIVIGAGSGGLGISLGMLEVGFKVLLIDKSSESIGGECLNTGCVPSKALLHVSNTLYTARKAQNFGVEISGEADLEKALGYVREKQGQIRKRENVAFLEKKGIDVELGTARFVSGNSLKVGEREFSAKRIVIATGSSPRTLAVKGLEYLPVFTNENVFDIDFLPRNFLFLGAGPVSLELGQAFARLGSRVTIVDHGSRILKKEDPGIAAVLYEKLKEENINFLLNTQLTEITSDKTALLKNSVDEITELPADAVLMGLGRELNFDSLDLHKAGVAVENGNIKLNDRLQTTNKRVFVSGDAADRKMFSHAAEMHNMILLHNFVSPIKRKLSFENFSHVTFTDPEIATFGLDERSLKERGMAWERLETDLSGEDRAVIDDHGDSRLLLFIEKKRFNITAARILGGSLVAPKAGEIVQELILANSAGLPVKELMNKIYPYPTVANAHKALVRDRFVKELRPWMKKGIRWLSKFNRL